MRLLPPILIAATLLGASCGPKASVDAGPEPPTTPSSGSPSTAPSSDGDPDDQSGLDDGASQPAGTIAGTVLNSEQTEGGWQILSGHPLSPRTKALGVWTGTEVLVIGGNPEALCGPTDSCVAPSFDALTDGMAVDPVAGTWRSIADAPVPILQASAVTVDDHLYLLATDDRQFTDQVFLRYVIGEDQWETLPPPSTGNAWYQLISTGDSVVAYPGSDENGEQPDLLFDPETQSWVELPPDPLSPSFDRLYVANGDRLILMAKDLEPNPGSEGPSLARVAELDLDTGAWETQGRSEILGTWDGVDLGSTIVFPWSGQADGGEVNNWGRFYPFGGTYEPGSGRWSPLPDPAQNDSFEIAGIVNGEQASFNSSTGAVLDLEQGSWLDLPALPDADSHFAERTVVAAGNQLFVFGGESWSGGSAVTAATYLIDPTP